MTLERGLAKAPDNPWLPGDVVLDADGKIWVRTRSLLYVWGDPDHGTKGYIPEVGVTDQEVPRPLTMLVRNGKAILTIAAENQN